MRRILFGQISIFIFISFSYFGASAQTQAERLAPQVNLLSRPPAIYTNTARKNKVEGTVRLKVIFLASGEIGEVTYISESSKKKKLTKYGLVEQAIEAAKQIKFEPAKRDGKPITVTKQVEYSFTLH